MRSFNIDVAGKCIHINANFTRVYNICQDFITDHDAGYDFSVQCSVHDYDLVADIYEKEYGVEAPSDVYLEEYALLEKISLKLIDYNTFLMHGAAIAIGDNAFLFSGKSGVGKTTHVLKWIQNCPQSFILNGDKPFIKTFDDGKPDQKPLVCGSPWSGKEEYHKNAMIPLKAVAFLERADNNSIRQISFAEAFPLLYQQIYRPTEKAKIRKTLDMLSSLNGKVTFFKFNINNFKEDCFQIAYDTLMQHAQNSI